MINIQKSYFNVWTKQDPWEYEADDNMKRIRKESLQQLVRETERYYTLWNQYYGKLLVDLESEIGKVDVNDRTIQRIIQERKSLDFLNLN